MLFRIILWQFLFWLCNHHVNYVNDIVHECRSLKSDVTGFSETQIKSSDSTSRIDEQLNDLNINFNNNDDKFFSLAFGCQHVFVMKKMFDINGMSIISLGKDKFIERVFELMLVCRKHTIQLDEFCRILEYYLQQII